MDSTVTGYKLDLIDTKEKIKEKILDEKNGIEGVSKTDTYHSSAYYYSLFRLIDEFIETLDSTILFEKLEPYWEYTYGMSYEGIELGISHYIYHGDDEKGCPQLETDQTFTLLSVPARYLTVEEYGKKYGVAVGTVRQWIRRAKIRTAVKVGNEWRISELTDPPKRGYSEALYRWNPPLTFLPDEFSYLKDNDRLRIRQCEDKQTFEVVLWKGLNPFPTLVKTLSVAERERLELYLIGNPETHFNQYSNEGPVGLLVKYYTLSDKYE